MLSCEFYEIFKNTFLHRTSPVAASGNVNKKNERKKNKMRSFKSSLYKAEEKRVKYFNNMWNLFKVNNDVVTRTTSMTLFWYLCIINFKKISHCSGISTADFE